MREANSDSSGNHYEQETLMSGPSLSFEECERTIAALLREALRQEGTTTHIFHYTNASGLLGILGTGKIWASDLLCLNDQSEYKYGLDIVTQQIHSLRYPLFESFPERISQLRAPWYVACFCENGDLLSQWRGYARHGDGYAIGFPLGSFLEQPEGALIKVRYEPTSQEAVVNKLLEGSRDAIERLDSGVSIEQKTNLGLAVFKNLASIILTFKHPSFKEEAEWRLLVIRSSEPNFKEEFRSVGGAVVPYINVTVPIGEIQTLRQGPGPYREINQLVLERLLKRHSCLKAQVFKSEIPFLL